MDPTQQKTLSTTMLNVIEKERIAAPKNLLPFIVGLKSFLKKKYKSDILISEIKLLYFTSKNNYIKLYFRISVKKCDKQKDYNHLNFFKRENEKWQ